QPSAQAVRGLSFLTGFIVILFLVFFIYQNGYIGGISFLLSALASYISAIFITNNFTAAISADKNFDYFVGIHAKAANMLSEDGGKGDNTSNIFKFFNSEIADFEQIVNFIKFLSNRPAQFRIQEIIEEFELDKEDIYEILRKVKYDYGEYLEIVENGRPTGVLKEREAIHTDGDWHRTVHIFVINSKGQILKTVRGQKANTSVGEHDISCAGHVAVGELKDTVFQELEEELCIHREEISKLAMVGQEGIYKKIGNSNVKKEGFREDGVYYYLNSKNGYYNREISTLYVVVIDLEADEINERLLEQGEIRPIEKAEFVDIESEVILVTNYGDQYTSTIKQYLSDEQSVKDLIAVRNALLREEVADIIYDGDKEAVSERVAKIKRELSQLIKNTDHENGESIILHVGENLKNSKTSLLFNYIFEKIGLKLRYFKVEVKSFMEFDEIVESLLGEKCISGIHPHAPFKNEVLRMVGDVKLFNGAFSDVGPDVVVKGFNDELWGGNFDGLGWVNWYESEVGKLKGKIVSIFGAGPSGRAIAKELIDREVKHIYIFDIDVKAIEDTGLFADAVNEGKISVYFLETEILLLKDALRMSDVVINATGKGKSNPEDSPLDSWAEINIENINKGAQVIDLNYRKLPYNKFLLEAYMQGNSIYNGAGIFVYLNALLATEIICLLGGKDYSNEKLFLEVLKITKVFVEEELNLSIDEISIPELRDNSKTIEDILKIERNAYDSGQVFDGGGDVKRQFITDSQWSIDENTIRDTYYSGRGIDGGKESISLPLQLRLPESIVKQLKLMGNLEMKIKAIIMDIDKTITSSGTAILEGKNLKQIVQALEMGIP
ncbi:MAG: hypothetical protein KAJ14_10455, partial [Candidatus Omnitrophica bacterium]|nr:hypothetical protein [Candidatus Omnitrophota bacterium]